MILLANIVEGAIFFAAGAVICFLLLYWRERNLQKARAIEAESLLQKARSEAEILKRDALVSANEEALRLRQEIEQSFTARRAERAESERRLAEREALINSQLERALESERTLKDQKATLREKAAALENHERDLAALERQRREALQKIAGLKEGEAREKLLKEIEQEALHDASQLTRRILDEAKARAEEKARQIISVAIQRYASEHTFENTTATIALPSDEIKGRIIGREGRNIRAFEAAAGVTILVDDTPGAVVISGFDPVRREIAREAMSRLIQDGRIHPTRIEEIIAEVSKEMDETVMRLGEEAITKAGLSPMAPEVVK